VLSSNHLTTDVLRVGANYQFGAGSGGPMAQADEAPLAPTGWTGFYLGVHGGFGFGRLPFIDAGLIDADIHPDGWLAGGHAGASQQFGRWLAGAEIDVSTTNMKSSVAGAISAGGATTALSAGESFDLLGSARARLGWLAWPNLLVYGTGGLAWTQVTTSFTSGTAGFGTTSVAVQTAPSWRWGWVAGLGAETRISHTAWLGRIEYLHYDFGLTAEQTSVSGASSLLFDEGRLTADVIRGGLSYQLN
jgi:outer membrane immunogenic protein